MRWRPILAVVLATFSASSVVVAQTAIRPDQICPGGCATPDITWGPGGAGYKIGSTIPWRTDTGTAPTFTSGDAAKTVELTNASTSIAGALPDTTVGGNNIADGFGFTIQVASGQLVLSKTGTTNLINGLTAITVGPYQTVALAARSNQWYASISAPVPSGAPVTPIMFVSSGFGTTGSATSTANATATATLSTSAAGNLLTGFATSFGPTAGGPVSVVASNGTSCAFVPGASFTTAAEANGAMFYCANNAGGAVTVTVTWGATPSSYQGVMVQEWAGALTSGPLEASSGKAATVASTTSVSLATNVALTQADELVLSLIAPSSVAATGRGPNQLSVNGTDISPSYQLTSSSGSTVTHSYSFLSPTNVSMIIAAFKH